MTDVLRLLATVAHHQAESSASDLEAVADRQEANLKKKSALRDLEKYYDSATADGTVTAQEMQTMKDWMASLHTSLDINISAGNLANGNYTISGGEGDAAKTNSENKAKIEAAFKDQITSAKEAVDDDQSQVQFQIQVGTSDLQNAENVRSQAEKRLEQQRKDLTRNWGG